MKFSKKVISLVISAALVAAPETVVFAQSDADFSHSPTSGWDSSKLSQAVLTNVNQSVRNYAQKKQSGQLMASDVEIAAASMKTTMDHLQEIGYNAALGKKILDNEEAFLNYHPNDDDVQLFQKALAAQGIQVDISRVRSTMDPGYEARQQFLSMVKKQGLYKTELEFVSQFRTQELQYVSQSLTNTGSHIAHHQMMTGRFVQTKLSYQAAACFVAAGVGLASGCTITVEFCVAGVILCGACAVSGAC
jgi:hypothetical protein